MNGRIFAICCSLALAAVSQRPAYAQEVRAAKPELTLAVSREEQKRVIVVTVTVGGKPLANATVNFYVRRTFGNLPIGQDVTLDDGTAAVSFPEGLPGGQTGQLRAIAQVTAPAQYASGRVEAILEGGAIVQPNTEAFPRALWAPRAPLSLLLSITFILCAVWCAFGFVVFQLFRIWRQGKAR